MQPVDNTLDLDAFEDVQIATVVLKNPATGAPTGATVEIIGPEHPTRKKITMDRMRKARANFQRDGKIAVTDPLDDIDDETDFLVACTAGWSGLTSGGQLLPHSAEEARRLYTDPKKQWLRAQVKKAIDDATRFISDSAKA
jgi:hypothetical protein